MNKKSRCPTLNQWRSIISVIGNGWGDGDFINYLGGPSSPTARRTVRALARMYDWLEDKHNVTFSLRPIAVPPHKQH